MTNKIYTKLAMIQTGLVAPKGRNNKFGGYNYRSCSDILEAVKPLLAEQGCAIVITDSVEAIGERYYIRATAKIIDAETGEAVESSALAREPEQNNAKMDASQVTGAASSYARKYALCGLLAIDDSEDADSYNDHGKLQQTAKRSPNADFADSLPRTNPNFEKGFASFKDALDGGKRMQVITKDEQQELFKVADTPELQQFLAKMLQQRGIKASADIPASEYATIRLMLAKEKEQLARAR